MLNLIKMDMYRLFRTKSFRIGLIIAFALSFSCVAVLAALSNLIPMLSGSSGATMAELPFANWRNNVNLFDIILTSTAVLSLLVSAVIASNFISNEQSNGYVKNIAGQLKNKGIMNISKFAALAVMSLSVLVAYAAGATLGGFLFLNSAMNFDGVNSFLALYGTKYLIYLAVNAIILFLCALTKSKSVSIAFAVMFGTGATIFVYNIISTFIGILFKIDLPISSYVPDGLIFGLSMASPYAELIKAIVVSVVYIAVFMTLSVVITRKRDTR